MGAPRKYSDEFESFIIKMYESGMSESDVADVIGGTRGIIRSVLNRNNIVRRGTVTDAGRIRMRNAAIDRIANGIFPDNRGRKWSEEDREKLKKSKKGGRISVRSGYIYVYSPDHPISKSRVTKYIPEHRLIMESHLGRVLDSNEIVHHKNGVKDDNRIENLEIVLRNAHYGNVSCPHCGKEFKIK